MSDLATTLSGLRESADLSRRQLEEVSGISEETLKKIEYGRNQRPAPETLRKIAVGLATNRALGRIDQVAADEMYASLMRDAGYLPRPEPVPEPVPAPVPALADVRAVLLAKGFPPDQAHVLDQIVADMASRSEKQRGQILNALADLLAPRDDRP